MILTCTMDYTGHDHPMIQFKRDIDSFNQQFNCELVAGYVWQQGLLVCCIPDELAFQFVLKHPEHEMKLMTEQEFREKYSTIIEFERENEHG